MPGLIPSFINSPVPANLQFAGAEYGDLQPPYVCCGFHGFGLSFRGTKVRVSVRLRKFFWIPISIPPKPIPSRNRVGHWHLELQHTAVLDDHNRVAIGGLVHVVRASNIIKIVKRGVDFATK